MSTPYTTDTSQDAQAVQLDLWRSMSGQQRIQKVTMLSTRLRNMSFDAIRRRHPEFSEDQVRLKFIELTYGEELALEVAAHLREKSVEPA